MFPNRTNEWEWRTNIKTKSILETSYSDCYLFASIRNKVLMQHNTFMNKITIYFFYKKTAMPKTIITE